MDASLWCMIVMLGVRKKNKTLIISKVWLRRQGMLQLWLQHKWWVLSLRQSRGKRRSAPLCNTIRQEAPVFLLLSQEDVLEQVFPTAGALTGEIAERGGRQDGDNVQLLWEQMEIESKYCEAQLCLVYWWFLWGKKKKLGLCTNPPKTFCFCLLQKQTNSLISRKSIYFQS